MTADAFLRRVQHRPRHTLRNPSSLEARVLNAFHDLHASMTTSSLPPAAVAAFLAGAGTSATALRFVVFLAIAFFGAMSLVSQLVGCRASRFFSYNSFFFFFLFL